MPSDRQGQGVTVAIIGGGFAGACLALHLARSPHVGVILVFEPRPILGLGLAYSGTEESHRINAPAQRMSLWPDDPGHFCRWLAQTGACANDAAAALPDGRLFPQRAVFGRYVAQQLMPLLQDGRVIHVRAKVDALAWQDRNWLIATDRTSPRRAHIAVLATGHATPRPPARISNVASHPRFISNPLCPGALAAVKALDRVLIIGTGLSMADSVASLHRQGHRGRIVAVSRRGQMPRSHAKMEAPPYREFGPPPITAIALLRRVRAVVAQAAFEGVPWQSVFDGLRCDAQSLWIALPAAERRRLLRHAKPFWDTHRHRLPPATDDILRRRLTDGSLEIRAATIIAAASAGDQIHMRLGSHARLDAPAEPFDTVLLTAGFVGIGDGADTMMQKLLADGLVQRDDTGQGLRCDPHGRAMAGARSRPLFVLGPPARGSIADITGVPEIARQAASIALSIASAIPADQTGDPLKHQIFKR